MNSAALNGAGLFLLGGGAAMYFYGWAGWVCERQWAKQPPALPTTPRQQRSRTKVARAIRLGRQRRWAGIAAIGAGVALVVLAAISN